MLVFMTVLSYKIWSKLLHKPLSWTLRRWKSLKLLCWQVSAEMFIITWKVTNPMVEIAYQSKMISSISWRGLELTLWRMGEKSWLYRSQFSIALPKVTQQDSAPPRLDLCKSNYCIQHWPFMQMQCVNHVQRINIDFNLLLTWLKFQYVLMGPVLFDR